MMGRKKTKASDAQEREREHEGEHEELEAAGAPHGEEEILDPAADHLPPEPPPLVQELEDKLQRVRAELQNYRRQSERRLAEQRRFMAKELFLQLLPLVDNFDAAISASDAGQDPESVLVGVRMIHEMMGQLLAANEVTPIESVGRSFDPEIHEAVGRHPTDEFEPNHVAIEIQRGYRMGDFVIRHARVLVAAPPAEKSDQETE